MTEPNSSLSRWPRDGLATRIIFLVFLSTFVTAVVVSGVSVHSTYKFVQQRIDETFPVVVDGGTRRLLDWLEQGQRELGEIAEGKALAAWATDAAAGRRGTRQAAELAAALKAELSSERFAGLFVLDPQGALQGATGPGPEMDELREVLKARTALDSELVEIMHTAKIREQLAGATQPGLQIFESRQRPPVPLVVVPVLGPDGQVVASLHGVFHRGGLGAQLRSDRLEETGDVYLADDRGRVVAAGHGIVESAGRSFEPEALKPGGGLGVRELRGLDGRTAIGSVRALGVLGWTVVVQQAREDAFRPLVATVKRILLINVCVFLLFSLLAAQIAAAIVRPIRALSAGARRISEGELDVELPVEKTRGEIRLLMQTFNDMIQRLRKNHREIEQSQRALQSQNEAFQRTNEMLSQLAITDGLTKLHNHRYFQDQLTRELKRISRTGEPLSILLFDIDDFKKLNDTYGHAAGDEFLVRFASILNETVRETDLVARYGGEEFVVVAVGTSLAGAVVLGEKIRTAVAESSFLLGSSLRPVRVTVSIGVSQFAGSRKRLFGAADEALYRAKGAGKNCVMAAEEEEYVPSEAETVEA